MKSNSSFLLAGSHLRETSPLQFQDRVNGLVRSISNKHIDVSSVCLSGSISRYLMLGELRLHSRKMVYSYQLSIIYSHRLQMKVKKAVKFFL